MPTVPLHPHPSAAPSAAAALPFELACGDEPPTAEDFADALNVAKNAALDVLVLALSGRTDEGLPTREALFAATRILAHSAHHDRLAATPPRAQPRRAPAAAPRLTSPPRATLPAAPPHTPRVSLRSGPPALPRTPAPAPTASRILPREGEVSPKATEGATVFPTRSPRTSPPAISPTPTPAPAASPKLPQSPPLSPPFASPIQLPRSDIPPPPSDFSPCDILELDELLVHGPAP